MSVLRPESPAKAAPATSPETAPKSGVAPSAAITPRAVLLALALIPINAWWLIETEYIR